MENTALTVEQEVSALRAELGGAAAGIRDDVDTVMREFQAAARTFRVACTVVSLGLVAALIIDVVMRSRND